MADRDDDLSWWDELRSPLSDDDEAGSLPPFGWTRESVSALDHVRSLLRQPLLGEAAPPLAPTLRSAAAEKLRAAGLFGETPAADDAAIAAAGAQAEWTGPRSWKLPSRGTPQAILGDDTAAGPLRGAGPNIGPARSIAPPTPPGSDDFIAPSAAPRDPTAPATSSPLDHPDARTGLALTAADGLLTKGIDLAVNLAGGDPAVARKLVEVAANTLAGVLPEEFRASALTSASAAAAEAERRIGDNGRATRNRAALGTLANRRSEAEQEHAAAIVGGDRAKIAEARREAVDAWRAEHRARGDGEAEINAAARALERDYRKTALRHRLAQMDEAGITRALDGDEDAKADPGMAREVAEDIRQIRRDDPARAGEASIEREIAARKRDGRIYTPEEEAAARYKLRLDAQAQRGIPEDRRRLLTNAERTALATEYHRNESVSGKEVADTWLNHEARKAGSHVERFRAELTAPRAAIARTESPLQAEKGPFASTEPDGVTSVHDTNAAARPRRQYAEAPGLAFDDPVEQRPAMRSDEDRRAADFEARAERHRSNVRAHLRRLAGKTSGEADALIGDILSIADAARAADWNPARRYRAFEVLRNCIDAATAGNNQLRVYLKRGAEAAFNTRPDGNVEDAFVKGVSGVSPEERAHAEIAKEDERDRRERQRQADERYSAVKGKQPNAGYPETLSEIVRIARETGALPSDARLRLMPELSPSREDARRLADPEKVLAQLEALRAIAKDEVAGKALPKSLRDLAEDYDSIARGPNAPRDPDELIRAVLQRGAPRRLRQVGEIAEMGAEIFTPWGSIVSLDDVRKSAQQAHDAFAAGRTWEGLEKSGDALWYLAMAAPIVGNVRRGMRGTQRTDKATRTEIKSERYEQQVETLKQNKYNAKISERIAEEALADAFKDYRVVIKPQKLEQTSKGGTRPDYRVSRDDGVERLFSIEVKDGDARQKISQRERQALLGKTHIMRVYRAEKRMTIDGIPAQEWFAAMRRKLDQMGLKQE